MLLRSAPLALLLLAGACDKPQNSGQPPSGGPACTTEAKMCPDGSGVGRTGPNCEFAPCPSGQEAPQQACTREAKVCPDGSAVGRTGPNCEFSPCPGEAPPPGDAVACTMDAKMCPDGTSVGRTGPKCEFAPCAGK